ncbi:MAG: calcium/sodium antiporter [Planctomycetota bacterium]
MEALPPTLLLLAGNAGAEAPLTNATSILYAAGGLLLLALGGELLVRGASAAALRLRLTPAVVGLTIISLGTSLPELVVSVTAQLKGSEDLAFANVVGSNLFNIGMVLGLCALLRPLQIPGSTVRLELPFLIVASFIALFLARDSHLSESSMIDRWEGLFLLISLAFFSAYMVRLARREVTREQSHNLDVAVHALTGAAAEKHPILVPLAKVGAGSLCLWLGGEALVEGSRSLALHLGITERVIGLTVVAAGTGCPELVATLVALRHGKTDMAIGNVIGSNIFNLLGILGCAALVRPLHVSARLLSWDLWWMLGVTLLLLPLLQGRRLSRVEGAILFVAYAAYATTLFTR